MQQLSWTTSESYCKCIEWPGRNFLDLTCPMCNRKLITQNVTALTTGSLRVMGNMKVIDWIECAGRWPLLRSIQFQKLGTLIYC